MKRAILVALGTGAIITSAAALTVGKTSSPAALAAETEFERSRVGWIAREEQRKGIEARFQGVRAQCDTVGGARRDRCLIAVHAARGRALLEAHAPYEMR